MKRIRTRRQISYATDDEVSHALNEFLVFLFFLILTTCVVHTVHHPYMFYMNKTIDGLFASKNIRVTPDVSMNFKNLVTIKDFWDYMCLGYLDSLHGGDSYVNADSKPKQETGSKMHRKRANDEDFGDNYKNSSKRKQSDEVLKRVKRQKGGGTDGGFKPKASSAYNLVGGIFILENILLGPPRVRQIRVKKNSCRVNDALNRYFSTCYAVYSLKHEEKTTKWLSTSFKTQADIGATPIWGSLTTYYGAGYVQLLTYDRQNNTNILVALQNENWIDRGTRLVVVEWNMYNQNLELFQSNKLIVELPTAGGVLTMTQIYSIRKCSFLTNPSLIATGIVVAFYVMVICYTYKAINDIRNMGRGYFKYLLNIIETIILTLAYLALVYNVWHTFYIENILNKVHSPDEFLSLDTLVKYNSLYINMMGLLCFFAWVKILKFIKFNKTIVQLMVTLKRCKMVLIGFGIMFLIVFMAYAQLCLLLFGSSLPQFRNFSTSLLTMFRMILHDFHYDLIEAANRVFGPYISIVLTYILIIFFILLNMFLAIIIETYVSVKTEITYVHSNLGSYLLKKFKHLFYFIRHLGFVPDAVLIRIYESGASGKSAHPGQFDGEYQQGAQISDQELNLLSSRVGNIEDMLERMVTNMERILRLVERQDEW